MADQYGFGFDTPGGFDFGGQGDFGFGVSPEAPGERERRKRHQEDAWERQKRQREESRRKEAEDEARRKRKFEEQQRRTWQEQQEDRERRQRQARNSYYSCDDYATLGLTPSATKAEIRAAWVRLAKANHPDLGGDVEKMKKINAAYERLKARA